jgi:hypothetical protein
MVAHQPILPLEHHVLDLDVQVASSFIGQLPRMLAHQPPLVPEYAHHSPFCAEQLAES